MDKTKVTVGLILMTLLSTGIIYLQYDNVKIRVDNDKTTFYVPSETSGRFVVAGRERHQLFDGSSLMYRDAKNIKIEHSIEGNTAIIKRITPYIRGPTVIDEYRFDGDIDDVKLFPIYHKITVLNAEGKFFRYEASDLVYDGDREKISGTRKDFGRDMSIEWQEADLRWAWMYMNGKLKLQFNIPSDEEVYYIRMFDPEVLPGDLLSFSYIYENLSKSVPVYDSVCTPTIDAKNLSHTEDCITQIKEYKTEYYNGKRIGVRTNKEEVYGFVNVKDEKVAQWSVPIGDRNFEEFGRCRPYEIEKGVCTEKNL